MAVVRALNAIPTTTLDGENDPTPERLMQAGVTVAMQLGTGRVQIIGTGPVVLGGDRVVRLSEAPLDRLFSRTRLDPVDHDHNRQLYEAGDKLRTHHHYAGLSGIAANDPNHSGGGSAAHRTPISETMERHRRALRIAESAMDAGDWRVVVDVVGLEVTLAAAGRAVGFGNDEAAAAVALDRLRRGLGFLAELWGFN
ncbi:hypothetical protein [Methylobacterium gossipiicola]|uniref:Uncharacterized protein n=1 Tax=Methylobacterium gossipiicola TaxID=582675 RepID=A0A1I2VWA6_9HYPH|nr:hypothetical protein [Methylobacterium gossipiicola]SFG92667.1 hypothetical protein SAMN05192565_11779 [Methylobacterium gossipiicola]